MTHRLKSAASDQQGSSYRNGVFHSDAFATAKRFDVIAKASSTLSQIVRERPATTLVAGLIVGALIGFTLKRLK